MKKYFLKTTVLFLVVVFIGALSFGCLGKTGTNGDNSATTAVAKVESKGTIYWFATDMVNGFNIGSSTNAQKFGQEAGYEVKVLDAKNVPDTQINQVETAISLKPKALMVKAVDNQTIVESINKAKAAGIKVMAYDNTIKGTKMDFSSVLGCVKVGELAANECLRLLKEKNGAEKGKILQIMGDLSDQYTVLIGEGFANVMKGKPDITLVTKDSPGYQGQANTVGDQLAVNKDIDIIFVHADSMIPSIVPVLEEKSYKAGDIKLLGTDGDPSALDLIRTGWITSTVGVPMIQQVGGMFQFLDDVLNGTAIKDGNYEVRGVKDIQLKNEEWGPTLYLPGTIITKDNVDDPNLWGNLK